MNQTIETIKNRRSVRQYSPEQIKDGELKKFLKQLYMPQQVIMTSHGTLP